MKEKLEEENIENTLLNERYTFDTFVQGVSNEMAYKATLSVIKNDNVIYNPLFIYSESSLGKTHLLQALAHKAIKENKSAIYVTAEIFLNDLIKNIAYMTMDSFQSKYRKCDILLIDNIQFILGKEGMQEELLYTLEELSLLGKQIVIAGLQAPFKMTKIEKRLQNVLSSGLVIEITKPQSEMNIELLKKKSEQKGIKLSDEMLSVIEISLGDSIPKIESFILQLDAHINLLNQDVNMDLIKSLLSKNSQNVPI